jgi:hypothetical protein
LLLTTGFVSRRLQLSAHRLGITIEVIAQLFERLTGFGRIRS